MSLGSWFREYVYIPLGGNRKGKMRSYVNLGIVFLLTGLWHGAAFSHVLWGVYHGFFSIIERIGVGKILKKNGLLAAIYCFIVVNFGWVLFRAEDIRLAVGLLSRMVMPWKYQGGISSWYYMDNKTIFIGICAILGMGFLKFVPEGIVRKWKGSVAEAVYCVLILFLSIAAIVSNTYNPFIYFQF